MMNSSGVEELGKTDSSKLRNAGEQASARIEQTVVDSVDHRIRVVIVDRVEGVQSVEGEAHADDRGWVVGEGRAVLMGEACAIHRFQVECGDCQTRFCLHEVELASSLVVRTSATLKLFGGRPLKQPLENACGWCNRPQLIGRRIICRVGDEHNTCCPLPEDVEPAIWPGGPGEWQGGAQCVVRGLPVPIEIVDRQRETQRTLSFQLLRHEPKLANWIDGKLTQEIWGDDWLIDRQRIWIRDCAAARRNYRSDEAVRRCRFDVR